MYHNVSTIRRSEIFPLPFRLLYAILVSSYFIYIPISFFQNNAFLFIQDILLILAILLTVANGKVVSRAFGGKIAIFFLFICYLLSVLCRFLLDLSLIDFKMITVVRNLTFGMGVLFISTIWVNTQERVCAIIHLGVTGAFIAALYGLRQLVFGFLPFELDRLSIMGASLAEMELLGRVRITSSFGDPMVFSFFMMAGVFFYFLARKLSVAKVITKKLHPISLILIVAALISTLTRAPLFGLMIGFIVYTILTFKPTQRNMIITIIVVGAVFLLLTSVNLIIKYEVLAKSENPLIVNINNAVESFWSLYQFSQDVEAGSKEFFLVQQSKNARSTAWEQGLIYMLNNPLGAGLANKEEFNFSIGDVGILSVGLQVGVIAFIASLGMYIMTGFAGLLSILKMRDIRTRETGYLFLSFWIAIMITGGISSILDASVINTVIWTIGGIIINQKRIVASKQFSGRI